MFEQSVMLLFLWLSNVALVGVVRAYALKFLLDQPNQRSSHQQPTPRGGGLASVLIYALAIIYLYIEQRIQLNELLFTGLGVAVAVIGFWDDHRPVQPHWRFLGHLLASFAALMAIQGLPNDIFAPLSVHLGWIGYVFEALFIAWMLNLFNFMDGIDGIAASEACFVSFGLASFLWYQGSDQALPALLLGVVSAGFLVWNWPPAKIFMGDVGSGFFGFMLGVLILVSAHVNPVMFPVGLVLFALFIADASYTLLRRMLSGQKWYAAHCSHAYQKLAKIHGHAYVVRRLWMVNLGYLFPLSALTFFDLCPGWFSLLLAYVPIIVAVHYMAAGTDV